MDRDVILLKEGSVYFRAAFSDPSFSTPIINTLIYRGIDTEHGHMFEEVTGENSGGYISCPQSSNINVLDQKALIDWLAAEHSQKSILKEYDYKNI